MFAPPVAKPKASAPRRSAAAQPPGHCGATPAFPEHRQAGQAAPASSWDFGKIGAAAPQTSRVQPKLRAGPAGGPSRKRTRKIELQKYADAVKTVRLGV